MRQKKLQLIGAFIFEIEIEKINENESRTVNVIRKRFVTAREKSLFERGYGRMVDFDHPVYFRNEVQP